MIHLEERNQKIIDAVVNKANIVCPESLALIGINGSFMTGDFYEKSDLDLLILINVTPFVGLYLFVLIFFVFNKFPFSS